MAKKIKTYACFSHKNIIFVKYYFDNQNFEVSDKAFYSWNLDLASKYTFFLTILVLGAIFGVCLFPVWPISVKIIIFYVSLVLLYVLVILLSLEYFQTKYDFQLGFIFFRILWFIVLRIFGVDSWVLPNLFEDVKTNYSLFFINCQVSFLDSFKPLISFERSQDGWSEFFARIIALLILAFIIYKLGQEPEIIRGFLSEIFSLFLIERVHRYGIPNF